jgi:hypothetical protein
MIPVFALHRALLKPEEFRIIDELVTAVLGVILPHGRFLGDQLRDAEATIERVITLAEVWQDAPDPLVRVSAADLISTLRGPQQPDPSAAPTLRECAVHDRAPWADKYAGDQP